MKVVAINFGNETFAKQQKYSTWSLKKIGKVDKVISYSTNDISDYLEQNPQFKKYYYKGFGNYFWKPYIIQKALNTLEENDFLVYMDSGTFILKDLRILCDYLEDVKKDILVFQLPLIEKQWTKKDAFILLDANKPDFYNENQILGTYMIIRNTLSAREFIEDYRVKCLDERIVSDLPNTLGQKNHESFKEHRHDQSVLSILARKSPIVQIERDLSDYGIFPEKYFLNTDRLYDEKALNPKNYKFRGYLVSNRKEHPLKYTLKYFIKRILKRK